MVFRSPLTSRKYPKLLGLGRAGVIVEDQSNIHLSSDLMINSKTTAINEKDGIVNINTVISSSISFQGISTVDIRGQIEGIPETSIINNGRIIPPIPMD